MNETIRLGGHEVPGFALGGAPAVGVGEIGSNFPSFSRAAAGGAIGAALGAGAGYLMTGRWSRIDWRVPVAVSAAGIVISQL